MNDNTLFKIAISGVSEKSLTEALGRINDGFDGGRVTKADLASWFIMQSAAVLNSDAIEEIRRAHFNQVAYLDTLVKKLKQSGRDNLSSSEVSTLQAMLGQKSTKKRNKPEKSDAHEPMEMS